MRPKTSSIWNYFDEVNEDTAKCRLCQNVYSRKGRTTSSLKSHLKSMHAEYLDQFNQTEFVNIKLSPTSAATLQEAKEQMTVAETSQQNQKWCNTNIESMEIDRLISEMISSQHLPVNFVEGIGFRRLMEFVAPNYQLRGTQFFTDYISDDSDSPDSSWSYFERTDAGARCAVCREPVPSGGRRRHLREHHPKLLNNAESEEETTIPQGETEVYTELVFLENEESPKKPIKTEEKKPKKPRKSPEAPKKRRISSSSDEEPLNHKKMRNHDEIEQFTKYITCLLKKLPQETCTELQMDIVGLILKKQLELKRKETSVMAGNKMAAGQSADDSFDSNMKSLSNGCSKGEDVNADNKNE